MSSIVKNYHHVRDEDAAVQVLMSIKKDTNVGGRYDTEQTIIFNQTLHLKEISTIMCEIATELKKRRQFLSNYTSSFLKKHIEHSWRGVNTGNQYG